jgi:serine-type D-Ala-D-Ala carboxypeptidase/endopeptidase (penicillin-binding protein 4)
VDRTGAPRRRSELFRRGVAAFATLLLVAACTDAPALVVPNDDQAADEDGGSGESSLPTGPPVAEPDDVEVAGDVDEDPSDGPEEADEDASDEDGFDDHDLEPVVEEPEDPPPEPDSREDLIAEAEELVDGLRSVTESGDYGVLVVDEYGREVVALDPDEALLPASTIKIVTAAAALTTFGPTKTFATRVDTTGPIVEGVLDGDLILRGGGDPVLATEEYGRWVDADRPRTPLEELADDIVEAGITEVDGDLVGVSEGFEGPRVASGWPERYFDSLDARYADSLSVDAGLRTLVTYPALETEEDGSEDDEEADEADGDEADGDEADGGEADGDDADGDDSNGDDADDEGPPPAVGDLPDGIDPEVRVEHASDPAEHATEEFLRLLEQREVELTGDARVGEIDMPLRGKVGLVESPPLEDLLRYVVQRSDNQMADAVFLSVGRERTGMGSFESAERAIRQTLDRLDIEHEDAVFADGSGLSRNDRASARLLVEVDRRMHRSRHGGTWSSLMAVTGESGTLLGRLGYGITDGRFAGKTGTLRDVSALVGSVDGENGRRYHLAVLANDPGEGRWQARALTDELIVLLTADLDGCEASAGDATAGPLGRPPLVVSC